MMARKWLMGVAILTACALAAGSLAQLRQRALPATGEGPENPDEKARPGLVCLGRVDLERGCSHLGATQAGRVRAVLVRENDHMGKDAPLVELEDAAFRQRVAEARAGLAAAQSRLRQARKAPAAHRLRLEMQRQAIAAARARLAAARLVLDRKKDLVDGSWLHAAEVRVAQQQVEELEANLQAEQNKLTEAQLQDPNDEIRLAEAEEARLAAVVHQTVEALTQCVVRAPCAGKVLRIAVAVGDIVSPGGPPMLIFAPDEPRIVRAEVDQEFAAQAQLGQEVQIEDEFDAMQRGTGRVTYVADWFLQRRELFRDPTRYNDARTLDCIVTPNAGGPPLRIGQRVRVFFPLSARR
jgi:multidrug efflux pump subunit AcrA (membrane-fusion protein)